MSNAMAFVLVVGIAKAIRLSCVFRVAVVAISIPKPLQKSFTPKSYY